MNSDGGQDDAIGRLLLRTGLKPHQLPAARRWLAIGLVGLLVLLAVDLVDSLANSSGPDRPGATPVVAAAPAAEPELNSALPSAEIAAWENRYNRELAALLSQVRGAGDVAVYVRLQGSPSQTLAQDVRTNTRSSVDEDERLRREQTEVDETAQPVMMGGGGGQPVIVAVSSPPVDSVLILADGADDADVRWRLQQAAAGALGLPAHRIQIVAREVP